MAKYRVGIDLGTTNCAVAYCQEGKVEPTHFQVPQLVQPAEVVARPLLPSFIYLPGEHELPAGSCALPWDAKRNFIVGELARLQGARVPGRLISSAKSWLCHAGVDRSAKILPWSAPSEVDRLSPVTASARFLSHLAEAWNAEHPKHPLAEQEIVLTVPASFDDTARQLTAQAASVAGFKNVTLLEEPQAAFYAWLATIKQTAKRIKGLRVGMTCLVADIGGGTTDFSLIDVQAEAGSLVFVRRAVGDHLLLGGDNMDLALARLLEEKLGQQLDAHRFSSLIQLCRSAKEQLLGEDAVEEVPITIMGRGSSLVAGTLRSTLNRKETQKQIFDGFFPFTDFDDAPERKRTGLNELGLPFVSDPCISKQLSSFLRQHDITPENPPDVLLFNGGVFTPESIRDRFVKVMRKWFGTQKEPWDPHVLESPSLDLAVALGAAHYAEIRHTGGRKIGGGLARSYYLAIAARSAEEEAKHTQKLLCVVPQHLEEGQTIDLKAPVLELSLGQPVQFPLYSSTVREDDEPGQTYEIDPDEMAKLSPLTTLLRGGKRSGIKDVPVTLSIKLTEIGTLELALVGSDAQRWKLEFNTRSTVTESGADKGDSTEENSPALAVTQEEVWPEERIIIAGNAIESTFNQGGEDEARQLTKELEIFLDASRERWPTTLCRRLADKLIEVAGQRRKSPAHNTRWFNLAGYTLRPGYGDAKDPFRMDQLWKLLAAPSKQSGSSFVATQRQSEGGADFWIFWRRVAGGLASNLQQNLFERLRPVLLPGAGLSYKPGNNELAEMWRAAASFERLEPRLKELLAEQLLKQLKRPPVPSHITWTLARLGARELFHGSLNHLVHPDAVTKWLEQLLTFQPSSNNEAKNWIACLANLARKVNNRLLDIAEPMREQVLAVMRQHHANEKWLQLVAEGGQLSGVEQQQLLGDDLPLGLKLREE